MKSDRERRLFAELVVPHLDDAYGLARWLSGNNADAEDIVQDACIRALASIETAVIRSAKAWLLTIVRNVAFTRLAAHKKAGLVFVGDALSDLAGAGNDATPEEAVIARADHAALERAIARLPLQFREAIVMRDFHDLSYREIADATGVPIGTVMSRLARARGLLLAGLQEIR